MSINFNFTVFTSPSADASLSPALLALIQSIATLNGVPFVQVLQTQPSVLRQFAAAAGVHRGESISAALHHGRDNNGLRRTLPEGTRYFSAPPRPIGQPRAPARAEDLSTHAHPTVRPMQEAMSTARRPGAAPPENTRRRAAVPPQAAPSRERSKAVSPSPPAEPARKRKLRDGTPAPPPANPKPTPTSPRDPSVTSGAPPPKAPAGTTLYSHSGKKRFTEEARAWFDAYWRWILAKGKTEGRLPPLIEASKIIYKHAREAGLDLCGPNAFKQYHSYYKESRMADIEMDVLGRQYCGGEELQPPPSHEHPEDPEDEDDGLPRKKRKTQQKEGNQQSTRIRLTEEERRHMVYRMGYDSPKGGRIKRVWAAMSRKFPERGFSEDQWEEAYQQNRTQIDQAVHAARPSVKVKSEG